MKSENDSQSRRNFLKRSLITGSLFPLTYGNLSSLFHTTLVDRLKIHIFSKHLQFLNYNDMAEAAAEMGFDGIDLTVRPDGHVLPEKVESNLPEATEAMRKVGLVPLLMTTAVQDAENNTDKKILQLAAKVGIQYYRMNYFYYTAEKTITESLQQFQQKIKDLSLLNKELKLTGCYQNHA